MHKRVAVMVAVLVGGMSFFFSGCSKPEQAKEEAPLVRTQRVSMDGAGQSSGYSGEVRGRYETQLAFQVSGKVIRRNVELGSAVNAGDVLMEIDTKDIRQTVNMSSAQVESAQSQLGLAEANLARYRKLFAQGAISRAQLDQFENAYAVAAASARQASAQYAQGTNQLGYSELTADGSGVIASIGAEAGQVVSAGQAVVTLVRDGEREVEIFVPENRIEEVRNAGAVRISFWALPGAATEGRVREVSPVADRVTRTYKVRISLVNPPAGLRLGMTASAAVARTGSGAAFYVPLTAIYQTGDTPNVWVIEDGAARLRPVRVGVFGGNEVQVTEGLREGDVIVTAGVQKLREGQKVRQ